MTDSVLTEKDVSIRPAMPDDAPEMAQLIDMAGGGVYHPGRAWDDDPDW